MTAILALVVLAQIVAPQQPARDTLVGRDGTGEAQIAGIVRDDTGAPIERAYVLLVGESADASRTAITGAEGRYALAGLPAGAFTLTVSKAGYRFRQFGQPSSGMRGIVIRLARSQRFIANITLPRGAAVAGLVLEEDGAPLPSARVTAYRAASRGGNPWFQQVASATADSRGRYRIFGAPAGELFISVSEPRSQAVRPISSAVKVNLTAGEQRLGVDVRRAPPEPVGRLHVTLALPPGMTAQNYHVSLAQDDDARYPRTQYAQTATFDVRDLPAGSYDLVVDTRLSEPGPRTPGVLHWAAARVTIEADRTADVALALQRGMTMSGRLVFEGATPPPANLARAYWSLVRTDPMLARMGNTSAVGRIDTTGVFTARDALPGSYTVDDGVFPGWRLKSIQVDGRDRTDTGTAVEGGRDVAGIVVTLTDRITEWRGTVRDAAGAPVPDSVLVIYPENDTLWLRRRITIAQPDSDGAFTVRGLPPGSYNVAAVTTVEPDQWFDPAFLKTLRPVLSLTLDEGQAISRDLLLRARQ